MTEHRTEAAYRARVDAADLARHRPRVTHRPNGDEERFAGAAYAMTFTKGLLHDEATGLVADPRHVQALRAAIDGGRVDDFTLQVPVGSCRDDFRQWEAPTAGFAHDLQGPDAQAVTMAPAPAAGSDELAYEMAEVYELALLRDEPLADLRSGRGNSEIRASIERLRTLPYPVDGRAGRPRAVGADGRIDEQTVFRGSSPGVDVGPYLSQFLLIGTPDQHGGSEVTDGRITYGALQIDQRVPVATGDDWLTRRPDWLRAQNGEDLRRDDTLFEHHASRRFITTPRDLATYVHDDALYQAYLNACLILLAIKAPTDPAFDKLSGGSDAWLNLRNGFVGRRRHAGGFALYGPPHVLTLVCEVATRALKAVRYQKFNTHLRLRPEALAARIEWAADIEDAHPTTEGVFTGLASAIDETVAVVRSRHDGSALLPMAFQEGSPMHPSYGAGHAAVAGACVTVLKAFFDTSAVFVEGVRTRQGAEQQVVTFDRWQTDDRTIAFVPSASGGSLVAEHDGPALTLEHELNKLAANISIGRNMAGVHYYSDYYDSLRLGEEVALGLLEEQALCYPTDEFVMTVPTFDGETRRIGARSGSG